MTSLAADLLENLLKSGGTQRYHTHAADLIKTQDTAQHAYNVTWLVYILCFTRPSLNLLVHALGHDAGERWAGDLPAPTKRALGIRESFGNFEADELSTATGLVLPGLTRSESTILKIADSLEGARFCVNEVRMGNTLPVGMLINFLSYANEAYDLYRAAQPMAPFNADLYFDLINTYTGVRNGVR